MPAHNPLISGVQYMSTTASVAPSAAQPSASFDGARATVIDGTPVRVVVLAFAAAAGLCALRMSGVKFNVGIS